MYITIDDLKQHFEPLGYSVELTNQFVAFHKNGNYVTLNPNEVVGSPELVQQEVDKRLDAGAAYSQQYKE